MCIRDSIILFVMLFLIGSFIDISTIHAEAGVEWIVKKEEIFEYVQKQYGTLPELSLIHILLMDK